ncbi:hypothetical protein KY362_03400, partial [Candidatus Woesearchaeota archaeon]|nr:hypothetical protein [Candidatus Woesearchaeota archaeon]
KTGKSVQREVKEAAADSLEGKKIGDTFKGESIDLPGYEFQVTGGSDASGFPMRFDVAGTQRKRITAVQGVGVKNKLRKPNPKKKGWRTIQGMRLKKTVAGNTIYAKTAQINLKVLKAGKENLFAAEEPATAEGEAAPAEAPKAAAPAEAPKEEKKAEPKPAEAEPETAKAPDDVSKQEVKEEKKMTEPDEPKEEFETVAEKTEEIKEDVEEVSLGDGVEDQVPISNPADDAVSAPGEQEGPSEEEPEEKEEKAKPEEKEEKAKPEEKEEEPAADTTEEADKLVDDVEKLDEEIAKDEEELKEEDAEIEKIEKELQEADSEGAEEEPEEKKD